MLQDINKLAAVTLFAGTLISPGWHALSSALPGLRKDDRLHNNLTWIKSVREGPC